MNKRVIIGMSGGVDSSVAAILLKEQGYEVIGVTLELWNDKSNNNEQQSNDAKAICDKLGIEHYTLDFEDTFKEKVINKFISDYFEGKTPNPCIQCNKYLKFNYLLQKAIEMDCDYIATGHYAISEYDKDTDRYLLKKSKSDTKDQTYVLYNLTQEELKRTVFPLGKFNDKSEIREIAKKYNLVTANKPDSQDICFIPNNNYKEFLTNNCKLQEIKKGNIVDISGNILGEHNGIINYTIGQRKGIGVTSKTPLFVVDINIEKNEIVVGEEKDIYSKELYANELNWIMFDKLEGKLVVEAKTRYSAKLAKCTIEMVEYNKVKAIFDEPQRAIAKGQSVVFYKDEYIVGGGIIL